VLAELAVANAAFGVIKSAISNSRELASVGKQIGDWIGAEETLKERADTDKNSVLNKVLGKESNDFESFLALDKLKEQRRELESHMRLYGRPGLFDSWVLYQAEARKSRRAAAKRQAIERQEMRELVTTVIVIAGFIGLTIVGLYFFLNSGI
jgi:hypothetical protein|tara:strand:+ start:874 stop:1329 length:456 start_codon:yes stop_codon:yes gene_type:complete